MPNQHYEHPEIGVSSTEFVSGLPIAGAGATVTYGTAWVARRINAPSERWVIDQIRAGRFPARKIGRAWRMTEQDIAEALEACLSTRRSHAGVGAPPTGLTSTSRKRLGGAAS